MRLSRSVYAMILALVGCATELRQRQEMPLISGDGYQGVPIPIEMAQSFSHLSRRYDGFWLPDCTDIAEAESQIAAYLARAEADGALDGYTRQQLPAIRAKLDRYRRQYVGGLVGTEKRIYCNVLTTDSTRFRNWRSRYIYLIEGAPDCWRIEYVPEAHRCLGFSADFGY